MTYADELDSMAAEIYRYMNFNEIQSFQALADDGQRIAATLIDDVA
jgi:aconitate hydratase 2/2-methylisocitrate dehydratase